MLVLLADLQAGWSGKDGRQKATSQSLNHCGDANSPPK